MSRVKSTLGRPKRVGTKDSASKRSSIPQYKFYLIEGLSIVTLQPSISRQKDCLGIILNMTLQEYEVRNDMSFSERTLNDNALESYDNFNEHGPTIRADEDNGIFQL